MDLFSNIFQFLLIIEYINLISNMFLFPLINRLIVCLAYQLLHHLCLGYRPTFHLGNCLLFILSSCISRGFPMLFHHMFRNLMLGIFTQCQQCHPCNSGRTNRYHQMKASYSSTLLKIIVWCLFSSSGCIRGFTNFCTMSTATISNRSKPFEIRCQVWIWHVHKWKNSSVRFFGSSYQPRHEARLSDFFIIRRSTGSVFWMFLFLILFCCRIVSVCNMSNTMCTILYLKNDMSSCDCVV